MGLRICLAAPRVNKAEAAAFAADLRGAGHTVPTEWWKHREVPGYRQPDCPIEEHQELEEQATLNLDGVAQCDVFVLLNLGVSEGKAVEMGYALGSGCHILVVGKRTNLFHYCSMVEIVATQDEALMALDNIEASMDAVPDPWDEDDRFDD